MTASMIPGARPTPGLRLPLEIIAMIGTHAHHQDVWSMLATSSRVAGVLAPVRNAIVADRLAIPGPGRFDTPGSHARSLHLASQRREVLINNQPLTPRDLQHATGLHAAHMGAEFGFPVLTRAELAAVDAHPRDAGEPIGGYARRLAAEPGVGPAIASRVTGVPAHLITRIV